MKVKEIYFLAARCTIVVSKPMKIPILNGLSKIGIGTDNNNEFTQIINVSF